MLFGTVLLSIHHIHDLSALFDPQECVRGYPYTILNTRYYFCTWGT